MFITGYLMVLISCSAIPNYASLAVDLLDDDM